MILLSGLLLTWMHDRYVIYAKLCRNVSNKNLRRNLKHVEYN